MVPAEPLRHPDGPNLDLTLDLSDGSPDVGLVVQLRFRSGDAAALMAQLREAIDVVSRFPGFLEGRIGRAIDEADLISVWLSWDQVGSYRRALSSYDVKVSVVPLLSQAIDEPSAYEVLHVRDASGTADAVGSLAADAGSVRLGAAAADVVRPAPS